MSFELAHNARNTLPVGRLSGTLDQAKASLTLNYTTRPYGQAAAGDALYFRDPVGDRREGRKTIEWTDQQLLRLCGLLDVYDYGDCAIEILEEFRSQLSKSHDVDALIQAATPAVEGVVLEYESYLDWSNKIRQKLNQVEYGDSGWQPKARLRQQPR